MINFLFLAFFGVLKAGLGAYSQRFSDEILDNRLCFALQVGFEFLESSLSTAMDSYMEFYNRPVTFHYFRRGKERFEKYERGEKINKELDFDLTLVQSDKYRRGKLTKYGTAENFGLVLTYPVDFKSENVNG